MPENRSKTFWIVYSYLFLIVLIRLIPLFNPLSRTWGFDHHIYLPAVLQIAFFAAAGIALILPLWRALTNISENSITVINRTLFESKNRNIYRGAFAIVFVLLFYLFSQSVHLLGDGYFIIRNLSHQNPLLVKTSEFGVVHFYDLITGVFGSPGKSTAEMAVRLISIISGGFYLFLVVKIAGSVTENATRRLLLMMSLILSGAIFLFFGYAEYYPFVWVLAALYLWLSLRYMSGGGGLYLVIAVFASGVLMHASFVIISPSLPVVLFSRGQMSAIYEKYEKVILSILGFLLCVGLLVFYREYTGNLFFRDIFLPLFGGKPSAPHYAVFSMVHLLDILNELILVAPLLPLFLILGFGRIRLIFRKRIMLFLFMASIGLTVFLFVIDPKLTMGRDWDLFSICLLVPYILAIFLPGNLRLKELTVFLPSIAVILFLSTASFVYANVESSTAVTYFENLIDMERSKSFSSMVVLNDYYEDQGNNHKVDSIRRVYREYYKNELLISYALDAAGRGDMKKASDAYIRVKPDKFSADYQRLKSYIYSFTGKYSRALEFIGKAMQLRPKAGAYFLDRGRIYMAMNQLQKAREDFYRGLELSPDNANFYEGLSYYYLTVGNYDSTIKYARLRRISAPNQFNTLYYLAKSYILKGNREKARLYYDSLLEFPRDDDLINMKRNEIGNLLDRSENSGD